MNLHIFILCCWYIIRLAINKRAYITQRCINSHLKMNFVNITFLWLWIWESKIISAKPHVVGARDSQSTHRSMSIISIRNKLKWKPNKWFSRIQSTNNGCNRYLYSNLRRMEIFHIKKDTDKRKTLLKLVERKMRKRID